MLYNLHDLKIKGLEVFSLESCTIESGVGRHSVLSFTAYVEDTTNTIDRKIDKQPIHIYVDTEEERVSIFHGVITKIGIRCVGDVQQVEVEAKSSSYLLDIQKNSRSFQDIHMSYSSVIKNVLSGYKGAQVSFEYEDREIGRLLVQYEETDWAFLKRIVSQLGITITPESIFEGLGIYVGIPKQKTYEIPYTLLTVEKDLHSYYYLNANEREVMDDDCIKYTIISPEQQGIFDQILLDSHVLVVRSLRYEFNKGEGDSFYELQKASGLKQKYRYPMHLIGTALKGIIVSAEKDTVLVQLDIDQDQEHRTLYWFPYSTLSASTDGSGWYCMPEKGDVVRVYFPSKYTDQAIAISSVSNYRTPKRGEDKMKNPDTVYLSTKHNKQLILSEEGIKIACNLGASIEMRTNGTIGFQAEDRITLKAEENLSLEADQEMLLEAEDSILAQCNLGGHALLTKDGDVVFLGSEIKVN